MRSNKPKEMERGTASVKGKTAADLIFPARARVDQTRGLFPFVSPKGADGAGAEIAGDQRLPSAPLPPCPQLGATTGDATGTENNVRRRSHLQVS
jgi:hypothetical protein